MWPRKMLQFTTGALLLLLPWFGGLTSGEVIASFSNCRNFFYKESPPKGFDRRSVFSICQCFNNMYHFATLYDRQLRTALYSAYLLSPPDGKRPDDPWMYEPQLVPNTRDKEMQPFPRQVPDNVSRSQAVLEDYEGSIYTKGHLAPSLHLKTMEDREASFTLTNIVPQTEGSNSGTWSDLEAKVLQRFMSCCKGPMYVITGTIPYKPVRMLNERVSIPEYLWSAYCCPSFRADLPESVFFPTFAAMGSNDEGYAVRDMTVNKLQRFLNRRLKITVSLFDGSCAVSKAHKAQHEHKLNV